jgi:hypothetical protein
MLCYAVLCYVMLCCDAAEPIRARLGYMISARGYRDLHRFLQAKRHSNIFNDRLNCNFSCKGNPVLTLIILIELSAVEIIFATDGTPQYVPSTDAFRLDRRETV